MSPRRRALLLLPSPLGLVEYDVLEETVFLGSGPKGHPTAEAGPFPTARMALAADPERGGAYVVRSLPGEPPVRVNGEEAEGRALVSGDRIQVGEHVVAFRCDQAPPAVALPGAPPVDAARRPRRSTAVRLRTNPWVIAVALAGAALLLLGLYLLLDALTGLRADERVTVVVPRLPTAPRDPAAPRAEPPTLAYAEAEAWEREHPDDLDGAIGRLRDLIRRFPDSPEADRARARIRERVETAGRTAFEALAAETEALLARREGFAAALERVQAFERRHGASAAAGDAAALRRRVREEARRALDDLLARVGPLVASDPRAAHRRLLLAGPEYPPDLAAEITALMEVAIERMQSRGRPPPEPAPPVPVEPGAHPRDPAPPPAEEPPADRSALAEAEARQTWSQAWEALRAGRYAEALEGYTLLSLRHADARIVRENRARIVAGRFAAKAGAQGPAGLLSVPAEERRGRLELEYSFDDAREVRNDFTIEQPFPSDRPVSVEADQGVVRMREASGLLHALVWEDDVELEAQVVAEVAHDLGMLAVADTSELRAVIFQVNNTTFRLKKGANARPSPGHLLWFVGQGVWADADADAIGYVKIAERSTVKVENGDRLRLEFVRRGERCEGAFHGRTDGAALQGVVRGDDGAGMGPARVGLFVNTGAMVVESVKIAGRVDAAWFARELAAMVDATQGPP